MSLNDTIVACATAAGYSSIAVIRISGPQTRYFLERTIRLEKTPLDIIPNRAYYGNFIDPGNDDTIDKVLITFFREPHSYTGEDVLEISCHGNPVIINKIIDILIGLGCRLAQHGEFTKRALLNEKIDLLQAEAILDTVTATCDEARRLAIAQYEGKLSQLVYELRSEIIDILSLVEAEIDFPEEEDIQDQAASLNTSVMNRLTILIKRIDILLQSADIGQKIKQGFAVLIIGRTNVGKSTLFNMMIGYDRAITHEKPGTTRDYIGEYIELSGSYICLYDTAGFLDQATGPDIAAQQKSRELLGRADLVILVFDGSEPMNEQDLSLYNLTKDKNRILVVNKIDKNIMLGESKILSDSIKLSAKTGQNLQILKSSINSQLYKSTPKIQTLLTSKRHVDNLSHVKTFLKKALETTSPELLAFELHAALEKLGELSGKVLRKDILEKIFSEFCIGK
jgi:tRNA modification GTPase